MAKERRCLSQKRSAIAVSEQSKRTEEDKHLLRALGAILDKAEDYSRLNALINSGLSMVQAIRKILGDNHG